MVAVVQRCVAKVPLLASLQRSIRRAVPGFAAVSRWQAACLLTSQPHQAANERRTETMGIVDTYADGEATVKEFDCGCEHVEASTYEAWFPCSREHEETVARFCADGRVAA